MSLTNNLGEGRLGLQAPRVLTEFAGPPANWNVVPREPPMADATREILGLNNGITVICLHLCKHPSYNGRLPPLESGVALFILA